MAVPLLQLLLFVLMCSVPKITSLAGNEKTTEVAVNDYPPTGPNPGHDPRHPPPANSSRHLHRRLLSAFLRANLPRTDGGADMIHHVG
ncbi:hypothetical protein K2173_002158 [Erythroxylum novogranatense]|uniref:Uncharacterized protein n=1 Tax=Erythroxylum novogranatense TaxID=1862640 RepID=A0AAV8SPZ6_9ROSI|nr:hypothetical protein K2173_002158 [Erythroxylum novogranatense]